MIREGTWSEVELSSKALTRDGEGELTWGEGAQDYKP